MAKNDLCIWWYAYFFDNPIRRLFQKREVILAPYLKPGMTALDLGCGMGFYSIAMAKIVGESGTVICVDLQPKMLEIMQKRARRAGVIERITPVQADPDAINATGSVDFAIAMWMVHELPDRKKFFSEVAALMKPDARFLIAEPRMHVTGRDLAETIGIAETAGLTVESKPKVGLSHAVVFNKK